MIVTDRKELEGTARDASGPGWTSMRLLVKSDGMGFSMTETEVLPGADLELQYQHHIEACYCISGEGTVTDHATETEHRIAPGILYAPDKHDRHRVRNDHDVPLRLICVFSPALQGDEVHDPDGGYSTEG
ncbi:ectoine synthase [uncultured Roseobacter sp.]|uniref:ectoine synthase n=1 Tax=uncultured Roseobacter sp. TaxID=114847 RepID=UPI002615669E|nr:ectoine synthase [uncultured Roseobacter sp.]